MIALDTSILVDALTGRCRSGPALREAILTGERLLVPSLVLYEFRRGPRTPDELSTQEALVLNESALPFGVAEAELAARLYEQVRRGRGREVDLAIAATAMTQGATLWTLNRRDFEDVPGLELYDSPVL